MEQKDALATSLPKILVNFVLDQSGSMDSIRDKTIDGFNEYINGLKKDSNAVYLLTLTLFDSDSRNRPRVKQPYTVAPINEVKPLTEDTYRPDGGTPLYDAIGNTVKLVENTPVDKFLCVVLTDGHENASQDFSLPELKKLIKEKEATDKWVFVFLGANLDITKAGMATGFASANTAVYAASGATMASVARNAARATRTYAHSGIGGQSTSFWKDAGVDDVNVEKEEEVNAWEDLLNKQSK